MAEQMEIIMKAKRKPEVEEILALLSEMTTEEKEEMVVFMQGVNFAKGVREKGAYAAVM